MKRSLAVLIVAAVYALHQDIWFWREARPLVFGVLPVGLFYHAAYTVATSFVLWVLVQWLWPTDLDEPASDNGARDARGATRP